MKKKLDNWKSMIWFELLMKMWEEHTTRCVECWKSTMEAKGA